MRNPTIQLAAIALSTAAGVLLAPVMASAQARTDPVTTTMSGHSDMTSTPAKTPVTMPMTMTMPMTSGATTDMSKMTAAMKRRGDAPMPGHHKTSAGTSATTMMAGMTQKMCGHATMTEVRRAHPELGAMPTSMMSMMSMTNSGGAMARKMRRHVTMAQAMGAHPELEKGCTAMIQAMTAKVRGHATMADAIRVHLELGQMS